MQEKNLRYTYDWMRFPLEEEPNYELVVRAESGAPHAYDVYIVKADTFTYTAALQHCFIDLASYTDEEILEWIGCWGYRSLEDFQTYLKEETNIRNYELRLVTCIVENDIFMKPEELMDGDYDECFDFLVKRLGGKSPLDDTDDAQQEDPRGRSKYDMALW